MNDTEKDREYLIVALYTRDPKSGVLVRGTEVLEGL